jgi:hypothetical protein
MTIQVIIRKSPRVIIVQFCVFVCVVVRTAAHFPQLTLLQLRLNWLRLCLSFGYKSSWQ